MSNLLLHNVCLADGTLTDLALSHGRIAEGGTPLSGAEVLDGQGQLVMPGFVEPHVHLDKCYLADGAVMGDLGEWGGLERMAEMKRTVTTEDILGRARRAILAAILHGTTSLRTHVDVDPIVGLKGIQALLQLREEMRPLVTLQVVAFPQEGIIRSPGARDLLAEALTMGADAIGGGPCNDTDREAHLDVVFDLAERFDVDVDLHVDSDPLLTLQNYPDSWDLPAIVTRTKAHGFSGRVTLGHFCSLSNLSSDEAAPLIEEVVRHRFNVVVCPTSEIHAGGREAPRQIPRNITRVKDLLQAGANVAVSFDNMRDPLVPFGNANPLQEALLLSKLCHLGTVNGLRQVWDIATVNGAKLMGLPQQQGLVVGAPADLTLFEATDPIQAMLDGESPTLTIKAGEKAAQRNVEYRLLF
jgi:cytosine/creatinine deaminase